MTKPHYRKMADGQILPSIRAADGFQNIVANLGTDRDKAFANGYITAHLSDLDLLNAYRGSSVAKAVIDIPAEDACREWREWQAGEKQISALEAEEGRLGLINKVLEARKRARLYGGSAIFIGTGDSDPDQPLSPEGIQKGGLKYLTILDRQELGVHQLQLDPAEPGYGMPLSYQLSGSSGQVVEIHPSRLVLFRGEELPNNSMAQSLLGWGDSVLITALEKVGHLDATIANVASLIFESKVDVVKIKDFTANLREGGSAYEQLMLKRFSLAMTAKGINGALMLDHEEEYQQKSANFSTLPNIIDRFMQMVSAAAEIPMTRLFGTSPAGLNSTGEGDLRNYYDRVKREQTLEIQPAMHLLDECLIRSALGSRPTEIFYNWRPLWQLSEKERAEVADKITSAFDRVDKMEVIPHEAIGRAVVNSMTEIGVAPGLEADVAEFYSESRGEGSDTSIEVGDAEPRTLYIHRPILNGDEIIAWAKEQGFNTTLPADDLHVTIAFSRKPVDWFKVGDPWEERIEVPEGGPRALEQFGQGANVLLFSSRHLNWRHHEIHELGAVWEHQEYQPHITISYADDAPDLADVVPYQGRILLGPEVFAEIKDDWQEGIKEE